jgi:amino acid permease
MLFLLQLYPHLTLKPKWLEFFSFFVFSFSFSNLKKRKKKTEAPAQLHCLAMHEQNSMIFLKIIFLSITVFNYFKHYPSASTNLVRALEDEPDADPKAAKAIYLIE